jgi:hypothetical protein
MLALTFSTFIGLVDRRVSAGDEIDNRVHEPQKVQGLLFRDSGNCTLVYVGMGDQVKGISV